MTSAKSHESDLQKLVFHSSAGTQNLFLQRQNLSLAPIQQIRLKIDWIKLNEAHYWLSWDRLYLVNFCSSASSMFSSTYYINFMQNAKYLLQPINTVVTESSVTAVSLQAVQNIEVFNLNVKMLEVRASLVLLMWEFVPALLCTVTKCFSMFGFHSRNS